MATVNKPTDMKQKEADVNRKLQLYGIFSAFKLGKVPSVSSSRFISSFVVHHAPESRLTIFLPCRMTKSMLP